MSSGKACHRHPEAGKSSRPSGSWYGAATLNTRKWVHLSRSRERDQGRGEPTCHLSTKPATREPRTRCTSRCSSRSPAAFSTDTASACPQSPSASVASARIVPGEPSGRSTTSSNTPFQRLNDRAAKRHPNNGCVGATTLTSHGNTARNCCSLSPSLSASGKPMWHKHLATPWPAAEATSASPKPRACSPTCRRPRRPILGPTHPRIHQAARAHFGRLRDARAHRHAR